ncbi:MAG TPA: TRAP transporter large permease [Alphaproteobacteria bacterium]|nr:TRAP transporter large permease [Alphaproteobacteria bacterium]
MDILIWISIGLMALLFLSGAPLAIAFGLGSGVIAMFVMGLSFENISQIFFSSVHSYPLLACPFFILAGNLILRSGGMVPLRNLMQALFGHWPGGLAVATTIFAAFLGSISGSSAACVAIIGTVLVPILLESGYDRPFASGLTVTAGELGLLIPPSLFFIIFGALNNISIADLFLAGIGPGLVTTFFMCIIAVFISKKRKYKTGVTATWAERWQATKTAFPVLFMPILILGGIYSGKFSPTQAASVAVIYSVAIGLFVYRGLTIEGIKDSIVETMKISSMIYFLIIGSDLMGRMFGYIMLPQSICNWVMAMELNPLNFLLFVNLLLLVMGFMFSSIPMVIIVLPLFLPTVHSLGIDPVFYGVLAVMNSLIGEITPPFGPQLWVTAPICQEKIGAIAREAAPFLAAWVLGMLVTTFIPGIAMFAVEFFR